MKVESRIVWHGDKAILAGHEIANKTNWEIAIYLSNDAKLLCPSNNGLLRASIMIRDKDNMIKGPGEFPIISIPPKDDVHVGTAMPYARHVEYGTGPHKKADKAEQFRKSIFEWVKKKGLEKHLMAIIRSIRLRGTKPHPFMRPAFDRASGRSVEVVKQKVRDHFIFVMEKYLKK